MSILIDIQEETEAELTRRAAARGINPEKYAATLIEEALGMSGAPKLATKEQFDRMIRDLTQNSDKIPLLPDDAFTREAHYRDHD